MDLARRIDQPEIMDTQNLTLPVMEETLKRLGFINRTFGGVSLVSRFLERCRPAWRDGETISILDVGTGGAEIPRALIHWGRAQGVRLRITAIDVVPEAVAIAKANARDFPEIEVREEDFFTLAKGGETFDYAIASLFLHHTPPEQTVPALRIVDRMARRGFLISDLHRSQGGYWAVKALCLLIGNEVVRHDGPLSVRRGFTVEELNELAKEAGLPHAVAAEEPWFRISLSGEKRHGA